MKILTFDIGGTDIKAGLFIDDILQDTFSFPTFVSGMPKDTNDTVQRVIKEAQKITDLDGIAVSTCGQVNMEEGSIAYANENMPGYTGTKLKDILEDALHVPVVIANDVVCAAKGEHAYGNAEGYDDFLLLTIGTGIGGALFLNGKPYMGKGPSCGIMAGAMTLHIHDDTDMWKQSFEAYASTTALVEMARRIDPACINGKAVMEGAENNPAVKQCLESWETAVAKGICSLVHVYNVPLVVLGGGIMENRQVFSDIQNLVNTLIIPGFRGVSIQKAGLDNKAGLYGAYSLFKDTIH